MTFLLSMHSRLLFTILLVLAALMVWSVLGALRDTAPGRGPTALLWIGELLVLAECGIGALLWLGGSAAAQQLLHVVYGVVGALTLPAAHLYARERPARTQWLVVALACLFLIGVVLRALATGRDA